MYKRFLRWASDRLDDDGIIAFVTNRAYLDARQDDGFRKIAAGEFSDIYILDLGSDVRRNPKISGTTHNVFGIQTGVAIGFFVRDKSRLGRCSIHYSRREDSERAAETLNYLSGAMMQDIDFDRITPDEFYQWLNQTTHRFRFRQLMPLADRQARFAAIGDGENTVFKLFSNAVKTNRDDWVYDFDARTLRDKALFFADTYNESLGRGDTAYNPSIKWSSTLRDRFKRGERIVYNDGSRLQSLWRPYVTKWHLADPAMNDRLTKNHYEIFGSDLRQPNKVINVCVNGKDFYVLASDRLVDYHFTGDTQCLPLYRYTADGERVCNITDWAIREINRQRREDWGEQYYLEVFGEAGITAEDIFAYTYGLLHDRGYRQEYGAELLQEFPRLPLYHDFDLWLESGRELLGLHLGFETAEPYGLERREKESAPDGGDRTILRADKERGLIIIDERTTLAGVPESAWEYKLGSRTALEWVLDQYRERKPRDPTVAAKFNTYNFADHKETVIDLLRRVCTVSERTARIMNGMAYWLDDDLLIEEGDRGTGNGPVTWQSP